MDITIFDNIINLLIGVPPEEFITIYQFIIYYTEVMIRVALFGFAMRFMANLFALPFRNSVRFFS